MHKYIPILLLCFLATACFSVVEPPPSAVPPTATSPAALLVEDAEAAVSQEQAPAPVPGGTLRLTMRQPQTLNPLLNRCATVAQALRLMYEPLAEWDETLRPTSRLGVLEVAPNGTGATFTLHPGQQWSDGTPITAADVVFSIQTLRNAPNDAIYKHRAANIAGAEATGEYTAAITFTTPRSGGAYEFGFPLIPRHHFQGGDALAPPGNGPFAFVSLGAYLVLERNPFTVRTMPYIQRVDVLITPDVETDLHAFDRGLSDVFVKSVPDWAQHPSTQPVRFAEFPAKHYEFVGFNFRRAFTADPAFRQAVAHAIGVPQLIHYAFLTHAVPADAPVHPQSWLYAAEAAFPFDMDRAQALVREATDGPEALTILVNENNPERVRMANQVAVQLVAAGLEAHVEAVPFDAYLARLRAGDFDLFLGGFLLDVLPHWHFAFHSQGAENVFGLADPGLDALLDAVVASVTDSQFQRAMADVQQHIAQHLPIISLGFRHDALVVNQRILGDIRPTAQNVFANVEAWHINE